MRHFQYQTENAYNDPDDDEFTVLRNKRNLSNPKTQSQYDINIDKDSYFKSVRQRNRSNLNVPNDGK